MNLDEALSLGASKRVVQKLHERKFTEFTSAQAAALAQGLCKGHSLLVSAPTSSGKTTIAEMAAVEGALSGFGTIYLVSHRALAEEKYQLFKREYGRDGAEWFDVSIATGDHTEGDSSSGILVATYEKYLAMICGADTRQITQKVVIADELQILGEDTRGPEIELLMTLVRRVKPRQLVVLSATIANPRDVADWLGCEAVEVRTRDVPLRHEIWYRGKSTFSDAGSDEVFEGKNRKELPSATLEAIDHLLAKRLGPILVFTMTKPQAVKLAESLAAKRQRAEIGIDYAAQLELFSEPSTLIRTLADISQKGVAFHTADLSLDEREMVERGLREKLFDVVFATPTLAAGVNFPFQTVLFDDFYRSFVPERPWLPLADFHNMAGRAGRLGMHDRGFAVLLPKTEVQFEQAVHLISSPVEPLRSVFLKCSLRKTVLTLVASRIVKSRTELAAFFEGTFWWHETADKNSKYIKRFPSFLDEAVNWLKEVKFIASNRDKLFPTRLGAAAASTGLLPQTVVSLVNLFRSNQSIFVKPSEEWWPAVLHSICSCEEFQEDGQRLLPYAWQNKPVQQAWFWLTARNLFLDPETVENTDRVTNATYALEEWCKGTSERSMRNMLPPISYGQAHQLGENVAWILDGVCQVIRQPECEFPLELANKLSNLCAVLRTGLPRPGLQLHKAARAYAVPGVGRHRIMELVNAKLGDPNELLKADKAKVAKLLESQRRAEDLIAAVAKYYDPSLDALKSIHAARAKSNGLDPEAIRASYDVVGVAYEDAILAILQALPDWKVSKIDIGKRQGYPDILISLGGKTLLLECKTKEKNTATLSKDEAFAVLQKGTDFKCDHRATVGKPDFDDFSKMKADGSREITLLRHKDLIEAVLGVQAGTYKVAYLFSWMLTPGFARLAQLDAIRIAEVNPNKA